MNENIEKKALQYIVLRKQQFFFANVKMCSSGKTLKRKPAIQRADSMKKISGQGYSQAGLV
jgi:hypothetical protein